MVNKTGNSPGVAAQVVRLVVLLGMFLTAASMHGRPATSTPDSVIVNGPASAGFAHQLFSLLNAQRVQIGLPPLEWDDALARVARQHSLLMAEHQELSHQFPGEANLTQRLIDVPSSHFGENLAVDSLSIKDAHYALMHSSPHRANILDPDYTDVGIGVVQSGNLYWVSQDFAHRVVQVSNEAAADMVASAFQEQRHAAGLPALERSPAGDLSRLVSKMSRKGRLNVDDALTLPRSRSAVAYTTPDPGQLSEDALHLARTVEVRRFAVGVCFAPATGYPKGIYWILIVLFH